MVCIKTSEGVVVGRARGVSVLKAGRKGGKLFVAGRYGTRSHQKGRRVLVRAEKSICSEQGVLS